MSATVNFTSKTIRDVCDILGDMILAVEGYDDVVLKGLSPLDSASDSCITFYSKSTVVPLLLESEAACILCSVNLPLEGTSKKTCFIKVVNPRLAFIKLLQAWKPPLDRTGIHPTASIHPEAKIDRSVTIGAYAVVGKSMIGADTCIAPHVTIYDNVTIGEGCIVNSHTVVGTDGFGYERNADGSVEKFPHMGGVEIGDHVEIGANTVIDQGTLSPTRIQNGCKIDNLVHIAHNVQLDENVFVIAHAMLGGSSKIGKNAWIAPGARVLNGLKVGAGAMVGMGAVVLRDVDEDQTVTGYPAILLSKFKALIRQQLKGLKDA